MEGNKNPLLLQCLDLQTGPSPGSLQKAQRSGKSKGMVWSSMIWFKGCLELFQVYWCIQWGGSPQATVQRAARIGPSAHHSCTEWEIWRATHWERWGWAWNRISLCRSSNESENIPEALFHTIPLGICYSSLWTLGLLRVCRKVKDKIKKMAFVGFLLKENCLRLLFFWRNSNIGVFLYQILLLSLLVKW